MSLPMHVVLYVDAAVKVSMVHRNFERVEEMVSNLIDMNTHLDMLEDMLTADSQDILGPAPNLLRAHYQIRRLESFRNETMHMAKKSSADVRNTLKRHFERLDGLIEGFEQYILALARNILIICMDGNAETVVKLVKIAEIEGLDDQKVVYIHAVSLFAIDLV